MIEALLIVLRDADSVKLIQPPVTQLVEDADDKLFQSVLHNPEHTLYQLLPDRRHSKYITYSLRPRQRNLTPSRGSHCIFDCNFIVRQLFKDSY